MLDFNLDLATVDVFAMGVLGTLGLISWKTGVGELLANKSARTLDQSIAWLRSSDGVMSDLVEELPYWDFYDDFILTKDGYLWAVVEVKPVPTGGYAGNDWKQLGDSLNRVFTSMPEGCWIQTIHIIDNDVNEALGVYERLGKKAKKANSPLVPLISSRARDLENKAQKGYLQSSKSFVFIGIEREKKLISNPLKSIFSSSYFEEIEREDFEDLQEEVLRARKTFINNYVACGGSARAANARVAFELAYKQLNPERAKLLSAPYYKRGRTKAIIREGIQLSALRENLFADNPRQSLCFTGAEIESWYTKFGDDKKNPIYVGNVSLYKLPTRTFAGLMRWLTQAGEIDFPIKISTAFQVGRYQEWDEQLERKLSWRRRQLQIHQENPNKDEEIEALEIDAVRDQLRKGEEKIGLIGLQISFEASSKPELKYRKDTIISLLRRLEGMEGSAEPHIPFELYLAGLPCNAPSDVNLKPCLSRDAVGLTPFTGSGTGVQVSEALHVFQTTDGRLFYWNPRSVYFNSGMYLVIGPPGSGKSSLYNLLRSISHLNGRRIVVLDFGGSSTRFCLAVGGNYIDVTDPTKVKGLGLFNIRPLPDEEYEPGDLTEDGLPLDKLAALEKMMEILCLNPKEESLGAVKVAVLRRYIRDTYANLVDEIPTIDDFIFTLENAHPDDKEIARELAARLSIYDKNSSLSRFLNDQSTPIPVDNPCTVFDFRGAIDDERLMLVATMAVSNFINRFLRVNSKFRKVEKEIQVDEFFVISQYEPILKIIDLMFTTGRKSNAIVSAASQSPGDFDGNEIAAKRIKEQSEVFFLFPGSSPEYVAKTLNLSEGEKREFAHLQSSGSDYKECLVLYPSPGIRGGCNSLRLELPTLDKRLMLGAGQERATLEEALADIDTDEITQSLYQALVSDPLGLDVGKNKLKETELI